MRSVLSISLPNKDVKEIKIRAQKVGKTVSAYILSVVRLEKNLISEDELVEWAKEAQKDYKNKKTKVLKSLKDLM